MRIKNTQNPQKQTSTPIHTHIHTQLKPKTQQWRWEQLELSEETLHLYKIWAELLLTVANRSFFGEIGVERDRERKFRERKREMQVRREYGTKYWKPQDWDGFYGLAFIVINCPLFLFCGKLFHVVTTTVLPRCNYWQDFLFVFCLENYVKSLFGLKKGLSCLISSLLICFN